MPDPFVFARVGWMKFYSGKQSGDERPIGGGSYNREKIGSELFNFKKLRDGRLLGFFQPGRKSHAIRLERILRGFKNNVLEGVLIVFVAKSPDSKGQRIVGWYKNAALHGKLQKSTSVERDFSHFICSADIGNAVLLPSSQRQFIVEGGEDGFGQSNICYPLEPNGTSKQLSWMKKAEEFVDSYNGENLLVNPSAEASSVIENALEDTLESAAGFESNPRVRSAIEQYAMNWVERHYRSLGYDVKNHSKKESYDFLCLKNQEKLYVEVKGTRNRGDAVVVTPNEVDHANKFGDTSVLYVVHSMTVKGSRRPKVSGGHERIIQPWNLKEGTLRPQGFVFSLPKES